MSTRLPLPAKRERRRWKRYWFNGSIQVTSGSRRIDGLGIQVSRGGMYLFAIADLPIGSEVKLAFNDPRAQQRLEVSGTVRHRAVYLYGVEFLPRPVQEGVDTDFTGITNQEAASS